MWDMRNQVMEAAQAVRATIDELPVDASQRLINTIIERFAEKKAVKAVWLWEYLKDRVSIRDEKAWMWVGEFIDDAETILFFDPTDMHSVFKFQHGAEVVPVLEQLPAVEFYLTNPNIEYLICFNHHDYLIACGTAKEWLAKKISKNE